MNEDVRQDIVAYRLRKANQLLLKTHMGVCQALGLHFVKTGLISLELGRVFSRIYDKRQSSDYDDFIEFTKEEIEKLYPQIKAFVLDVEKLVNS